MPATAVIAAIRVTDRQNGAVVVDRSLADEPADSALQGLAAQLRTLRAQRFVADGFAEPNMVGGEERPWRYRVDVTIALPDGTGTQTETETWHFTERVAGTLQLGGSERFAATFELEQPLLDALWRVTYGDRDPGPPAPSPTPAAAEPKG